MGRGNSGTGQGGRSSGTAREGGDTADYPELDYSSREGNAYLQAQYAAAHVTPKEEKALTAYVNDAYGAWNDYLNYGGDTLSAAQRGQLNAARAAVERGVIDRNMTVYRGVGNGFLNAQVALNPNAPVGASRDPQPGDVLTQGGFSSTSLSTRNRTATFEDKDVQMVIRVPAGMHGLILSGGVNYRPSEAELLLPPGTRYRVIAYQNHYNNKQWGDTNTQKLLTVLALPPEPTPKGRKK